MPSSSLPALTLALGLAVGAGVGYLVGQGPRTARAAGPIGAPAVISRTAAEPTSSKLPSNGLASVPPIASAFSGARGSFDASELSPTELRAAERAAAAGARVVEEVQGDRDPSWTHVIAGSLVDENGAPLPGATVLTYGPGSGGGSEVSAQSTDKIGRGFQGIDPLGGTLETYAKQEIKRRKGFQSQVTDDAGAFRLDGLQPGTHGISAYLEGYVIETKSVETMGTVQLIGTRVGVMHLELTLPDGEQPEEAVVLTLDSDDDERVLGKWTPAEPIIRTASRGLRIRIIAGTMQRIAWDEMAGEFSSEVRAINLDRDGEGPHAFKLKAIPQVHVKIKDESTVQPKMKPWARIVRKDEKDKAVKPRKMRSRGSGPFIVTDLEPGSYEVTVGRGSDSPELTESIEVAAGIHRLDLTLGDLDPSRFAVVRCIDPSGAPIAGVEFRHRVSRNGNSWSGGSDAVPKPGGEYWIPLSEFADSDSPIASIAEWTITLTAETSLYGNLSQTYVQGKGVLVFTFQEPANVVVMVQNPLAEMRVNVRKAMDDPKVQRWERANFSAVPDREGRAAVGQMQPGEYTIELTGSTNEWYFGPAIAALDITVKSGDQTFMISAPALNELVVHAPDLDAATTMYLQKIGVDEIDSQAGHEMLGDDQRVRFPSLAPGDYMLYAWGSDNQQQMEITVPCGEVVFEQMAIDCFEVTAVTKGKAADRAGLKTGDLILGIDKYRVKGKGFFNRLAVTMAEGPSKLLVKRGGGTITLDLEQLPEDAAGTGALGADMRARGLGR